MMRALLIRPPGRHGPLGAALRGLRAVSTTRRAPRARGTKTVVSSADLPTCLLDERGQPVPALGPHDGARRRLDTLGPDVTLAPLDVSPVPAPATELGADAAWAAAVDAGTVPDTPLARQVFETWLRFPGCIVLTRVGKFYESYFNPAHELASLLSLKLAYKRYKSGLYAFAGFQVGQLDKYLGVLVRDLAHTVVLVEEYDADGARRDPGAVAAQGEVISRRVGRVVTPGTLGALDDAGAGGDSRYLLAMVLGARPRRVTAGASAAVIGTSCDVEAEADDRPVSLAYADVSTGEFFTKDTTTAHVEDELARIAPREVVLDISLQPAWEAGLAGAGATHDAAPAPLDLFNLLRVLGVRVSFGGPAPVSGMADTAALPGRLPAPRTGEQAAIDLLRHYLEFAFRDTPPALQTFNRLPSSAHMQIDAATLQCLEIRHAFRPGGLGAVGSGGTTAGGAVGSPLSARGSLLSVLARTVTASGHRLLVRALTAPSTDLSAIGRRHALVQALVERAALRADLRAALAAQADVMRLVQKFKLREGEGRHVWDVARWARGVERLGALVSDDVRGARRGEGTLRLRELVGAFRRLGDLAGKIEDAIDEGAVMRATDDGEEAEAGEALVLPATRQAKPSLQEKEKEKDEKEEALWWIKPDFSPALRAAHDTLTALRAERDALQDEIRRRHRVDGLVLQRGVRAGFVVGVARKADFDALAKTKKFETVSQSGKTLAYLPWTTLGYKIEAATEKLLVAQRKAFEALRAMVVERAEDVQHNAELVDELDLALSFAQVAVELNYVRPVLTEGTELDIVNGRHPAVESGLLASARAFTPNSTRMAGNDHLHVITGPNQGGKSTLLRQTAVIAILAQAGSFVPADAARIGVVDKVFSRVGARDDLFRDRSTFMLEMVETAAILRGATERSLVIMDEIGRGTTLHAGVSIAYATLDYILTHIRCRTLFATHYHELGDMLCAPPAEGGLAAAAVPECRAAETAVPRRLAVRGTPRAGVSFWCTDVDEMDGAFAYSYRLQPGINRQSHAMKAAQLAGMPASFLETARATLAALRKRGNEAAAAPADEGHEH